MNENSTNLAYILRDNERRIQTKMDQSGVRLSTGLLSSSHGVYARRCVFVSGLIESRIEGLIKWIVRGYWLTLDMRENWSVKKINVYKQVWRMCVKFLRVSNRGRPITRCGYIWRDRLTGRRTCTILQPKACAILSTCESVATKIDTLFDESVHPSFLDSHDISLCLSSIPAFISHDILCLSQWSLIRLGLFCSEI